MKILALFSLVLGLFLNQNYLAQTKQMEIYKVNPTPDASAPHKVYIPRNLGECFIELKKMLHPQFVENLKKSDGGTPTSEEMFLASWIAENWGLRENSHLAVYFESYLEVAKQYLETNKQYQDYQREMVRKLIVPEETSHFIVGAFRLYLKGEIPDAEKHMRLVKSWRTASKPPQGAELSFPQCRAGVELKGEIEGDSIEEPKVIHYGRCKSDNKLWAFERGKGWYLPNADLTKQIINPVKFPSLAKPGKND